MKRLWYIAKIVCMASVSILAVSCGLVDMDIDEIEQTASEIKFKADVMHVMLGDTFVIEPVFLPDTVDVPDVVLQAEYDSIVKTDVDCMIAVGVGETKVNAVSLQNSLSAQCTVVVMPHWKIDDISIYSDDMVVYARVTVNGQLFNPETMKVGAFVGPDFRGVGEVKELNGITYLQFRIYSYFDWGTDEPSDAEMVRFGVYDSENLAFTYAEQYLMFDGETHGSPSQLFEISVSNVE